MAVSAFNNPAKKRELLKLYKQGSLTLEQISAELKVSTAAVGRQLRKMKAAGLVKGRKIAFGGQTVKIQKEESKLTTFLENAIDKGEAQYRNMTAVAKEANVKLTKGQVGRFFDRYPSLYKQVAWVTRSLSDNLRKWLMETGPDGELNYKRYYKGPLTNIDEIWTEVVGKKQFTTSNVLRTMRNEAKREKALSKVPKGYISEAELATKLGTTTRSFATLMTKKAQASEGQFLKKAVIEYLKPYAIPEFKNVEIGRFYKNPDQDILDRLDLIRRGKGRLDVEVVENVFKLFNDKASWTDKNGIIREGAFTSIKKGIPPDLETILHLGLTETEGSTALMNIARKLNGVDFFQNPELDSIKSTPELKTQSGKILTKIYDSAWGRVYYAGAGNKLALQEISDVLGNKGGRIQDFKNAVVRVLRRNDIPLYTQTAKTITEGFNVNEPLGTKNIQKNKLYPFAHFVNLLEGKINTTNVANLQGRMGNKFIPNIDVAIKQYRKTGDKKFLNEAYDIVKEFKTARRRTISAITKNPSLRQQLRELAIPGLEITEGENLSEILQKKYGLKRIKELADKGYDIKGFAEKRGFLPTIAKGTPLFEELLVKEGAAGRFKPTPLFVKAIDQIKSDLAADKGNICSIFTGKASGGRVGMAKGTGCVREFEQALERDADGTMNKLSKLPSKGGAWSRVKTIAGNILNKLPKGGRLGAIAAGAGAVGAGTYAMTGGAKAEEPSITDEMTYNATEGKFVKPDGDPETQEGVLNWIADNPIKSALAPVPVGMGAGLGAQAMNAPNVANFFRSMKFMLPPAYAAEKLYQYKEGQDLGEMFTNPLDAVWAMALDTPKSAAGKMDYYKQMASKHKGITSAEAIKSQQLGLKPSTWKNIGKATMAPRSFGTSLVFPFAGPKAGTGAAMKVLRGGLRLAPLGPLPMALLAGSMAWDKYKFNKKIGDHVDALRSQGVVNEEDAQTMSTIYKQGWLGTTAIGAKLLGSEELMFEGEMLDIEAQKKILSGMKDFYGEREDVATKERVGERQEDFFSWFSKGGRVGLAEGGNKPPFGSVTRRGFLKWLVGSIAVGTAALTGRGLKQAAKTVTTTAGKKIPAHFVGVEGMPEWFFRSVEMFKLKGKLKEMADKDYVQGDMYEMMLPVKRTYSKGPRGEGTEVRTEMEKVIMEENPLTGEISMQWTGTDNFGADAVRSINFKPGRSGFQKFGVDDPEAAAQGISEYRRVKVEEPEFNYTEPNQADPYREDIEYLDIFTEGDEVVEGLANFAGVKPAVTKETQALEKEAQKKLFKDIEGEEAIIPEPEGVGISDKGDIYGEEQFKEIIEGEVPDHLKKKAEGGIIETGNIARRPGAVPPLSGPDPQGSGIIGLFSRPKRVKVA